MIKKIVFISVLLIAILFILDNALYFVYPNVSRLRKENPKKTAFMKYTEKRWKREGIKRKISQRWVRYSNISPYLIKAVLIAEDDKFWSHDGFDIEGMEKALEKNIKAKKFKAGGSTISQQLAKNLYLSPSRNPVRKLKEAILTWRMEKVLKKRRILEIYLNVAQWGDGIFGIEAAARHYYGKSASGLGPEEAARLASVLPNPKKYNPVGSSRYVANRSRIIYGIMVRRGIVIEQIEEEVAEMNNDESTEGKENVSSGSEGPPTSPAAGRQEDKNPPIQNMQPVE
jgi:monofunctional biosynthetic peptidoglycan transglycosylase